MIPVILQVHVDDGKWVDVPITPETSCRDVLECCREPSDQPCRLVQSLGVSEFVVPADASMTEVLNHWGHQWPEVTFYLQYSDPVAELAERGAHPFPAGIIMRDPRRWPTKLPEGNELSLAELRQMAARQQHQIEAHQQLLVAKEQRLKFLKQQEARHHHQGTQQAEGDRLRHLRERVELQELKLRRLRALRGQVEQHRSNNNNLSAELESIRALFNEKEKELSMAVAKVEELTRQLEDVRRGDVTGLRQGNAPSPAALEFQKLRRELLYRSKLNEQQNARIAHQRETLARRQAEISQMDQRIAELQQRLQRKRLLNQQLSSQLHAASRARPRANIAAVEPLKRAAQDADLVQDDLKVSGDQSVEFTPNKKDPKYQTLPYNTKFPGTGNQDGNKILLPSHDGEGVDDKHVIPNGGPPPYPEPPNRLSAPNKPAPPHGLGNLSPRPFGSTYSTSLLSVGNSSRGQQQPPMRTSIPPNTSTASVTNATPNHSKPAITAPAPSGPRSKTPVVFSNHQVALPPTVMTSGQPGIPRTVPQTPVRLHPTPGYSQLRSRMSENSTPKPAVPPKPCTPSKPVPPPRQIHGVGGIGNLLKPDTVDQAISVLKGNIRISENYRFGPKVPLSALHQRSAPSTFNQLTSKPDTLSEANREQDSECEKSSPQTSSPSDTPDQVQSSEGSTVHVSLNRRIGMPPAFFFPENQTPPADLNVTDGSDRTTATKWRPVNEDELRLNDQNHVGHQSENEQNAKTSQMLSNENASANSAEGNASTQDAIADQSSIGATVQNILLPTDSTERNAPEQDTLIDRPTIGAALRRVKKGNLKTKGAAKNPRRVSFDPLALLLDAALEGELELVKKTAKEVTNPSAANDEGITALHNAICAGHLEIVKFLVEFGCDVNAQDSDGWTPLHCAASCNNLAMVKYLVERGACIFATTLSDHETAAEKCEEDEEGFDGCSEYLYSMQEKLGILNGGVVYALYDYDSQNSDELSFRDGDQVVVLRKGDDLEREWWWSKQNDREGYVPRNLLGLYPRVIVKRDQ